MLPPATAGSLMAATRIERTQAVDRTLPDKHEPGGCAEENQQSAISVNIQPMLQVILREVADGGARLIPRF